MPSTAPADIETDMACNPQGLPPIGAAAKEVKGIAHTLEMNVQAIQAPVLKTLGHLEKPCNCGVWLLV
ncbi:hypothetical protein [Methylobacterium trifolii]|uniref:Uncharacterized protein n=1 Tax=Methylobacterium trifolii TaxID=1003092 RepID=A0ABQ4U671_9HYPH|nr:hypothetical protein [Methylobacterium trifolii]GJE62679.1 hypothetical protein MPOCJGCO_4813 [Methylobacterium trifolii]